MPGFAGTIGGPLGQIIGPKGEYGSISAAAIGAAFSAVMQPFTHGASQLIAMGSNRINPVQLPSYEQILKLWHGGNIGDVVLAKMASLHGVRVERGGIESLDVSPFWRMYNDKSRPVPPLELLRKWARQGRIDVDAYFEGARRHGMGPWVMQGCRGQPFADLIRTDYENLPAALLQSIFLMYPDRFQEIWDRFAMLGYPPDSISAIFQGMRTLPGLTDGMNMYRRKLIDLPQLTAMMHGHGITSGFDQQNLAEMLKAMPEPAGLLSVAGKQLWDAAKATRWGLDAEMPEQFELWASRMGSDYGSEINPAFQQGYRGISWQQMLWRSHWNLPSVAVMAEWIRRFRGDPNNDATWSEPGYRPITDEEKADIWQASGVAPEMRRHYEKLLWQPLSIRHIRLVYTHELVPVLDGSGNITQDGNGNPIMGRHPRSWLHGRLMSTGINDQDANSISRAMVADAEERDAKPGQLLRKKYRDRYIVQVEEAYRVGSANKSAALGQLTTQGIPDAVAQTILATIDLQLYSGVIKAIAANARKDFLGGRTDKAGAHNRLTMAGVIPERATLYVQAWEAEFGEGRRHLSTERVLRALRRGFISEADALHRLDNIGWARADELIMLAEVEADVAKDQASLAKAESMAQQKQAGALQRLLDKAQKTKDKIVAGLRRTVSPSTIMKWLRDGIWTMDQAAGRLKLLGYDPATIADMMAAAAVEDKGPVADDKARAEKTSHNLAKLFPPSKIEKWYIDGTWTEAQFASMLSRQGFTPEAISGRIEDAKKHIKPKQGA